MNLEFEMSVRSCLGGRWDVLCLPEVIDLILYLQIGMFDPAAALATYLSRVLYSSVTLEVAHVSFLLKVVAQI